MCLINECIYLHTTRHNNPSESTFFSFYLLRGDRNREEAADMGLGASNMGPSTPSHPRQRRRPSIRRSISAFLLCGAPSFSYRLREDCPAELLVTSAVIDDGERLKDKRKGSDLSQGRRGAPVGITETRVSSSGRQVNENEIPALQTLPCNVGPGDKGKCLSESGEIIPCISTSNSTDTASAFCMVQPSLDCVSAVEIANFDVVEDINNFTSREFSEIKDSLSNSNHLPSHGYGESSLDEILAGRSIAEAIDSNSEDGSSFFSDSPIVFHVMQNDNLRGVIPSTAEFIVSEREQSRQEGSLLLGDLMSVSSNILLSNSVEIDVHDIRNFRRTFSVSRNSALSTDESDYSGSPDSWHHDFSGGFFSSSLRGSLGSRGSGTPGNNELGWNSRSELWEGLHGNLDFTDIPIDMCPRRIHVDSSSTEESGSRPISRIVLLAQTLFEVLDQIHQQPMPLSLSMASLPAPESVVDSLPVKIHRKKKILGCAEDVSQCHICLAAYEEGDKIRVLPCLHEYHMSCVDKWLNEIRGVCPLCRGDVCKGVSEDLAQT